MVAVSDKQVLLRAAMEEKARRDMRESFATFFRATEPNRPYIYGKHTLKLLKILDGVTKDVERGISRFVNVALMFRSGKSDQSSRRWPAWCLLRNPDWEIILASHEHRFAGKLSHSARECFREVGGMYGLRIPGNHDQISDWGVSNHRGSMFSTGIGGGTAGHGGDIIVIDDPFPKMEAAESEVTREKVWESFRWDLMTRRAPVCGVVVVNNRWNRGDIIGKIQDLNNRDSENHDPNFPIFENLTFPAQNDDGSWLFPERFSPQYYEEARALLGEYAWSAMGQQNPQPRLGNRFRVDMVHYVPDIEEVMRRNGHQGGTWRWGFDVASSDKERNKPDPDYTYGTLLAVKSRTLYIKDVLETRHSALKRDQIIEDKVTASGVSRVKVEVVGGYKDAWSILKQALKGQAIVHKYCPRGKLAERAMFLEAIFEAGNVYVQEAPWNHRWAEYMRAFPDPSVHDDAVASLDVATHDDLAENRRMVLSR